jgi:hypothetical protein
MERCNHSDHTHDHLKRWSVTNSSDNHLLLIDAVMYDHIDCLKLLIDSRADSGCDWETPFVGSDYLLNY